MTMMTNRNHCNSINDTVGLRVNNVTLSSGSVEQAVQDRHQATVSLIAGYPGQSSPNLLQDSSGKQVPNLIKQVSINKKKSHQCRTAKSKTKLTTIKDKLNYGLLNA